MSSSRYKRRRSDGYIVYISLGSWSLNNVQRLDFVGFVHVFVRFSCLFLFVCFVGWVWCFLFGLFWGERGAEVFWCAFALVFSEM